MTRVPEHSAVVPAGAPAPIGPYSPAVAYAGLIFISGQVGVDPATGKLAGEGMEEQTAQALANLASILEAAGSGLDRVLRCGVFLTDMAEFPRMNAVYEKRFTGVRPARTTVQVSALPGAGAKVEIDAVAYAGGR